MNTTNQFVNKNEIFIVIPSYNDTGKIKEVINEIIKFGFKNIIVVDDGSKDENSKLLNEIKGITLIKHVVNLGQGAALQTGMDLAKDLGAVYIVHCDADGQHPINQIDDLVKEITTKNLDIVMGSRFLDNSSKIPFKKRIILKLGIIFTFIISGLKLTDTHNGFRIIRASIMDKLTITLNRFEHASEIIDLIALNKLKYSEIPVKISYSDYSNEKGQKISNSINLVIKLISEKLFDILSQ